MREIRPPESGGRMRREGGVQHGHHGEIPRRMDAELRPQLRCAPAPPPLSIRPPCILPFLLVRSDIHTASDLRRAPPPHHIPPLPQAPGRLPLPIISDAPCSHCFSARSTRFRPVTLQHSLHVLSVCLGFAQWHRSSTETSPQLPTQGLRPLCARKAEMRGHPGRRVRTVSRQKGRRFMLACGHQQWPRCRRASA